MMNDKKKTYPKEYPPRRVFFNWELTHDCNYTCSYCQTWRDDVETPKYYSPAEWKRAWDRIFDKYYSSLVRFSGGEPSIYPGFVDMVAAVADKHSIDITTNLSFDEKEFADKVLSGAVAISASYHPEFNDIHNFLRRVLFLHESGFPSSICYVAYPAHLKDLAYTKEAVEDKNILFKFLPFTGNYKGKEYPAAYTPEERKMLKMTAEETKDDLGKKLNTAWYDWNAEKRDSEDGVNKEKICRMGQMYAFVHTDLSVTRCCGDKSEVLGNIMDEDFILLEEAAPCDVDHCPCFKAMLPGEEARWASLWDALPHPRYKLPEEGEKK